MSGVHAVVETPTFIAKCKAYRIGADDRAAIVEYIARNPRSGVLLARTGGARKLRFAGSGRGKSGGYRAITFFGGDDIPVFLLSIYAKNDLSNLTQADRNALKAALAVLPEAYRKGAKRK